MIIFLNGTSSAGKTTLSRALQQAYPTPLLYLGVDLFCGLLPAKYLWYAEQADQGVAIKKDENGTVRVVSGPIGKHLFETVPHIARTFVDRGHDLIIDEVLDRPEYFEHYQSVLSGHPLYFIKVHASNDMLDQREKDRGDRTIGMARSQAQVVHNHGYEYDFAVNTGTCSPEQCAQQIIAFIEQHPAQPLRRAHHR